MLRTVCGFIFLHGDWTSRWKKSLAFVHYKMFSNLLVLFRLTYIRLDDVEAMCGLENFVEKGLCFHSASVVELDPFHCVHLEIWLCFVRWISPLRDQLPVTTLNVGFAAPGYVSHWRPNWRLVNALPVLLAPGVCINQNMNSAELPLRQRKSSRVHVQRIENPFVCVWTPVLNTCWWHFVS